jgi:hypothetical protein
VTVEQGEPQLRVVVPIEEEELYSKKKNLKRFPVVK